MSDFDDDQFENTSEGMAALRKHARQLEKSIKEKDEALKAYVAKEARVSLEQTFTKKGYPAGLAKLYHGDDHSEDAVSKWVDENKELFNIPAPQAPDADTGGSETTTPPDEIAAAQRMQSLAAGSSASTGLTLQQQIDQATDPEALTLLLRANKIGVVG